MSDVVWQALIAAVVTVVLAWMQQRNKNAVVSAVVKAETTAKEGVDKVAAVATDKIDGLTRVTRDVHTLVNSQMGAQLRMHMEVTRRLSEVTPDPRDPIHEAAKLAKGLYEEHQAKQAKVDADIKTDAIVGKVAAVEKAVEKVPDNVVQKLKAEDRL